MDVFERLETLSPAQRAAVFASIQQHAPERRETIPRCDRTADVPASFAQQRLWMIDQFRPGIGAYHIPVSLRLRGALDVAALRRAVTLLAERHETLRTTLLPHDGSLFQRIAPEPRIAFDVIDLAAAPADPLAEAARIAGERAATPFDLAAGPLFRTCLVRMSASDCLLSMTFHHAIFDGWSTGVAVRDLGMLYTSVRTGAAPKLPPLRVQYADYAAWQRARLSGDRLENLVAYWRQQLAGAPEAIDLQRDRRRPRAFSYRGDAIRLQIQTDVTARIRALCHSDSTTPFSVLLAAFAAVLGCYSHDEDIVIGTPVAGRVAKDVEPLIGMFVNTLPLRLRPERKATFRSLVKAATRTVFDAQSRQDLPLDVILDRLRVRRTPSHAPLFQTLFVLQASSHGAASMPDLDVLPAPRIEVKSAQFDLTMSVREASDGTLIATIEYSTDLFLESTIRRLGDHYLGLLTALTADPDRTLGSVPLANATDLALLNEWNETERSYEPDVCLHTLFERQVAATPDAQAVVCEGERLTYAQFNARVNRLAHYLRRMGVSADRTVGICLARGLDMLVAVHAIVKAGAAYVPLDPSFAEQRLTDMVGDANPCAIVTTSARRQTFRSDVPIVCLDRCAAAIEAEPASNPALNVRPDNLAYVIYTSGTTGRPKGAMIPHRGIVNRLVWMQEAYGLRRDDRVLQKTPFTFDVSVWELFWPLLTGATVAIARPDGHRDSAYLADVIERERITVVHFIPSMLDRFLKEPRLRCDTVRLVISSGEALRTDLRDRVLASTTADLENLYGPTEASVDVTYWNCRCDVEEGRSVPIGRPIANTRLYVLDAALNSVPWPVVGEIYIAGIGLARGYHRRPGLTAERFVPDPFAKEPGSRMYRSGDLGAFRRDGALEYLGRLDHQVKVRGVRVELEEVEAVLAAHPSVRECAAALRGQAGDERLIAYIVVREKVRGLANELRSHVRARLPEYMVPSAVVLLDVLPRTPGGKVDRRALPEPSEVRPDLTVPFAEPRTIVESVLAEIWSTVLRVDRVGIEDNFFELGGDSMKMLQIVSLARDRGLTIATQVMYEQPTIAALAPSVEVSEDGLVGFVERLSDEEAAELLRSQHLAVE